jgi:hypothetical protein
MAVVRRIGPASAFKVGLVVYAILGLIGGVLCALVALAGVPFARHAHMPLMGSMVGLFAVALCPIFYGIIGGMVTLISALLYNLASNWTGGLEVEIN